MTDGSQRGRLWLVSMHEFNFTLKTCQCVCVRVRVCACASASTSVCMCTSVCVHKCVEMLGAREKESN